MSIEKLIQDLSDGSNVLEFSAGVHRLLHRKFEMLGPGSLNHCENTVYVAMNAFGSIVNGGFYCCISTGTDFDSASTAFDDIGIPEAADALRDITSCFPGGRMHADIEARCMYWADFNEALEEAITKKFLAVTLYGKRFDLRLADYVRANRDAFLDLKEL